MKANANIKRRVVNLFNKGISGNVIASRLGLGSTTVYRILRAKGIYPLLLVRSGKRKHGNKKYTDDQEQQIVAGYRAGASLGDLGKTWKCDPVTIKNILKHHGVVRRNRGNHLRNFTDEQIADIAKRWRDGESQSKIAIAYKTHQTVISTALRMNDIEPVRRVARGERSGGWRGGRTRVDGYIFVKVPNNSPLATMRTKEGYIAEHRLVMAQSLGRVLSSKETVHHINGDRSDNRIENLQLRIGNHGNGFVYHCADCGSTNIVAVPIKDG